jgi:hypothetical protein
MIIKTLLGWVLIIAGLLLVFWSVQGTYNNFTGKTEFPRIFSTTEGKEIKQSIDDNLEGKIGNIVKDQLNNIISQESTEKMFNMTAWIMFATFLVFSGSKVVAMGTGLIQNPRE